MWSVPYNLNIYNSYFAVGVVQLNTKFSRDMLPYWYYFYYLSIYQRISIPSSRETCFPIGIFDYYLTLVIKIICFPDYFLKEHISYFL